MPFMTVFMVHNVGLPIRELPLVYVITGAFSIVAGPLIGRASDAFGKLKVFAFGCAMTVVMVIIYTHLHAAPFWMLIVVMVLLQIGIFSRMISSSALMSALPKAADRGSYMSISSSLQQVSGGVAAAVAGLIVVQIPGGPLLHYDTLGYILVCTTLISLALMYRINRKIGSTRPAAAAAPPAAALAEIAAVTE
jgi:predicted MFS family arabinose efflux permease